MDSVVESIIVQINANSTYRTIIVSVFLEQKIRKQWLELIPSPQGHAIPLSLYSKLMVFRLLTCCTLRIQHTWLQQPYCWWRSFHGGFKSCIT